jgi:hypothetical protein
MQYTVAAGLLVDASAVDEAIALISECERLFLAVQEGVEGTLGTGDFRGCLFEAIDTNGLDVPALGASQVRISLQPTKAFAEYVAALAARQIDGRIIERVGHSAAPG